MTLPPIRSLFNSPFSHSARQQARQAQEQQRRQELLQQQQRQQQQQQEAAYHLQQQQQHQAGLQQAVVQISSSPPQPVHPPTPIARPPEVRRASYHGHYALPPLPPSAVLSHHHHHHQVVPLQSLPSPSHLHPTRIALEQRQAREQQLLHQQHQPQPIVHYQTLHTSTIPTATAVATTPQQAPPPPQHVYASSVSSYPGTEHSFTSDRDTEFYVPPAPTPPVAGREMTNIDLLAAAASALAVQEANNAQQAQNSNQQNGASDEQGSTAMEVTNGDGSAVTNTGTTSSGTTPEDTPRASADIERSALVGKKRRNPLRRRYSRWPRGFRQSRNVNTDATSAQNGKDEEEDRKVVSDDVMVAEFKVRDEKDKKIRRRKPRVVWSEKLHERFVAAVEMLGVEQAVPRAVLQMMNVRNLTRENVASHLQKYRNSLKAERGNSNHHHHHSRRSSGQEKNVVAAKVEEGMEGKREDEEMEIAEEDQPIWSLGQHRHRFSRQRQTAAPAPAVDASAGGSDQEMD